VVDLYPISKEKKTKQWPERKSFQEGSPKRSLKTGNSCATHVVTSGARDAVKG
jgi:hypothetical protein